MKSIIFKTALLETGWASNVCIEVDDTGIISKIDKNASSQNAPVRGYAIPGMNNVHSHAFQRAMAGLAEYSTTAADSFWTWRDLMYRFAQNITAEDLCAIASQLYLEMLKAGYISVCEFHYLHHDKSGNFNMSQAIIDAANETGLALCHLPVLYMNSGFGGKPLNSAQQRFGHKVDDYMDLLSNLDKVAATNIDQHLGMAFHSLRAVPVEVITDCISAGTEGPIHIHIAEQEQEVSDCTAYTGKRPVQWLFDNVEVDQNWCLVHATHLDEQEISAIARSGVTVGICPTTEANLGDGLFPLPEFIKQNGQIAIGSDSHISVSVSEELRLLEYGQRLKYKKRNIAADETEIHTGTNLYKMALDGGAAASGFNNGAIAVGKRADIVVLDENSPLLIGTPTNSIIDRYIFSGNVAPVNHVYVGGKLVVENGRHSRETDINQAFSITMERLKKLLD